MPRVVGLWLDRADNKDLEIVLSVDAGDEECIQAAQEIARQVPNIVKVVINDGDKTCVAGWNAAAAATTGQVIIAVADDFFPPEHWDTKLWELKPDNWWDEEHVVHVDDGYVHNIIVLGIVTRKRYEKFGYLFYPGYESLFCDTELTETALRDNVVIDARSHLLFEHMHPDCQKRQRDSVDLEHASQRRWDTGEALFKHRLKNGFPVDAGPKAVVQKKGELPPVAKTQKRVYCCYSQLTKDDFCLEHVCLRMMEQGVTDFFWSIPDSYWDGSPGNAEDLKELRAIADRLKAKGAKMNLKLFKVADYRMPGDTRIDTETRLRNDALQWIRESGFEHILIVDGDELWRRGTLDFVDRVVNDGYQAISCYMVPVIGLPGYPVHQATDLAVVYIGGTNDFKACRTPFIQQMMIPNPLIFHFTGTRKTMEEIIRKHRASGHYDDPDYDFETWIEKVLPNIKPGFVYDWGNGHKGVHMYTKYQIWPCVREFFPEEVLDIPKELYQYLGLSSS